MNRVFSIQTPLPVPGGTVVYLFLNSKDSTSHLPWNLVDAFSLSAGEIKPRSHSKIHVMPLVTQVIFVLDGVLEVRMKDDRKQYPYLLQLQGEQAVLTLPGTFFQLINPSDAVCRVLYIVSPAYLFDMEEHGQILYDDAVVLDDSWEELARNDYQSVKLHEACITPAARQAAGHRVMKRATS